jgi:uncharacterized protein (DUF362 family)
MGAVYDEFQTQLAEWDREYSGRPKAHLVRLCLLALEREEIVSVAYRDERIAARLAKMPLPDSIRRTIQHALMWAWKDEEMHAIYIRGAILRLGSRRLRTQAFAKQIAGGIGGWSSAVIQHLRWREAPVSRTLASALTTLGSWTGQVPEDVKEFLNYGPFRDFCLFNVDAERTAAECWRRMAELAGQMPELPSGAQEDFCRVKQDEENHEKIFSIVAEAVNDNDTLDAAETPAGLMQKISAVGEFFVPRAKRTHANPLGHGGSVWVTEVSPEAERRTAFRNFLESSDLPQLIGKRIEEKKKGQGELRVVVKTSFMLGYHRADPSPLTDPALLEELAIFLRDRGCGDIAVGEGRNLYDTFYANRTVADVAAYFHIQSPHYRVVDFTEEQEPHSYARGFGHPTIARTWRDADFRINFGKLRSHPVEIVYLCLGNMEGIGPRNAEFIFAERQAHRDTAVMTLLGDFPPDYALLDAFQNTPDGILGIMGSRHPLSPRRFYGGADALAVDIVAASHIGLKEPSKSSFLRTGIQWFGDPRDLTTVVGPNNPIAEWKGPFHNEISGLLSLVAYPVYQFGSGRGSLFLPEMDEEAFPFLHRANLPTRFARGALRRLLGLRPPRFEQR